MEKVILNLKEENATLNNELTEKAKSLEPPEVKPLNQFPCNFCDYIFGDLNKMRNHSNEHQEEKCSQTLSDQELSYFFDQEFQSKVDLSDHVRVNHVKDQVCQTISEGGRKKPNSEPDFPCFYCGKVIMNSEKAL